MLFISIFKMIWENGLKSSDKKISRKTNFRFLCPKSNKYFRIFKNQEDQLQGWDKVEYQFLFFQKQWDNWKMIKKSKLLKKINFITKCTSFLNWKKGKIQLNNTVHLIVSMFGNVKTIWNQKIN